MASLTGVKTRRFLQVQPRQSSIKLHCFQKSEPMTGERGESFESISGFGLIKRHSQISCENRWRSEANS